ncbi:Trans-cinnamate 4-monooxygenase, partial [Zea mays]
MDLALLEKALLGLFAAAVVAIAVAKLTGKRYRLPPGPPGAPVVGNWLQVGDDLNHRNLMAMAKRFGDIFLLRMGVRNLVVVSTPELAKEVLHTQGVEFGSRTRNVVFDIFTGKGQDMVFTVYGDHWRKMRRIMTVPFFTNKVVAQNRAGWEEEARLVVEDVRKDPEAAAGGVVLRRRLQLMMYNDMFRIMFDRRFDSEHDPLFNKLKALNAERSRLSQSFEYNYGDFIPVLRPFLRGYLNRCHDLKTRRMKVFEDNFVQERKKVMAQTGEIRCAMDHILEAERKGEINHDNVLYIVENINVAGIDNRHCDRDDAVVDRVGHRRAGEPPGHPAQAPGGARLGAGRRRACDGAGPRAPPLPSGHRQGDAPPAHGHPAAGPPHEPQRRQARRLRHPRRVQDPRQCLVPRQRPQEVGAPRRVPARALPGGGEVRGGPRQRLPIRALWGRPPELPWDHPRAAYHRHHPGPAGAELPAAAAAGAGQDRHHGEARPVQQ